MLQVSLLVFVSYLIRYAVTKDPQVKKEAWKTFEALEMLETLTPIPGLLARTFGFANDSKLGKNNITSAFLMYIVGPNWHNSTTNPEYKWMSDISSDDVTGYMFAYGITFDLLAETPGEKSRVQRIIQTTTEYIVKNNFVEMDVTGERTRWGVWAPEYMYAKSTVLYLYMKK